MGGKDLAGSTKGDLELLSNITRKYTALKQGYYFTVPTVSVRSWYADAAFLFAQVDIDEVLGEFFSDSMR